MLRPLCTALLLLASCAGDSAHRYVYAADPASRYGFRYVQDRPSGKWVYRDCELRVASARDVHAVSLQLFRPGSASSGGLEPEGAVLRDGYRVWRVADILDQSDLTGRTSYGVQADGGPMELIRLPALRDDLEPGAWSEWVRASDVRAGAFGWWEEAQTAPRDAAQQLPEHPFEMRCRMMLSETPRVP